MNGKPHPHSFLLDSNGKPFAKVVATRAGATVESGLSGFTFMKSTESGWENYIQDKYTTIPETHDRMAATAMDASWRWSREPADYEAANARILSTLLGVFATTYSRALQETLYLMGRTVLEAHDDIAEIRFSAPNKHHFLVDLSPFGVDNDGEVFIAADRPYGLIEATVTRDDAPAAGDAWLTVPGFC